METTSCKEDREDREQELRDTIFEPLDINALRSCNKGVRIHKADDKPHQHDHIETDSAPDKHSALQLAPQPEESQRLQCQDSRQNISRKEQRKRNADQNDSQSDKRGEDASIKVSLKQQDPNVRHIKGRHSKGQIGEKDTRMVSDMHNPPRPAHRDQDIDKEGDNFEGRHLDLPEDGIDEECSRIEGKEEHDINCLHCPAGPILVHCGTEDRGVQGNADPCQQRPLTPDCHGKDTQSQQEQISAKPGNISGRSPNHDRRQISTDSPESCY